MKNSNDNGNKKRVAVSSTWKVLDSNVNELFGRCPYFIIAEIENKKIVKIEAIENKSMNQMGGAGIAAAQMIAEKKVDAVITWNIGPKAFDVLKQFDIEIYKGSGSAREALRKFMNGKLEKINKQVK